MTGRARGGTAAVLGTVCAAGFAAGAVLTQAVVVPAWRALDPGAFLARFPASGPVTGAVLFPLEVAAAVLLAVVAVRRRDPLWAASAVLMAATLVLLPVYFVGANTALLDPAFPPGDVPAALARWNAWNWARTGLALGSAATAAAALVRLVR